ncbi:hypothetical protein TIFTF001_015312 [Ficus carica]|uniref:Transposase MuDR plant domain-containing protein n=1 Tax=Ficus carica TaxID=3494 RepID=A0AA88A100_FICCA|nr:hypothetical protein TIFTF001_015312 [Ficus carica]
MLLDSTVMILIAMRWLCGEGTRFDLFGHVVWLVTKVVLLKESYVCSKIDVPFRFPVVGIWNDCGLCFHQVQWSVGQYIEIYWWGLKKTIVMRYAVEPGMPPMRMQCDTDYVAEVIPPEVGESNHIPVQLFRDGGHSDKAVQLVTINNLIISYPIPPPISSPIVGLDLHMKDGLEEQDELLNKDLDMNHDDCNTGELNVTDAARDSNERSIAGNIGAQSIVNRTRTQSVHFKVKRSTTTLLHVVCIDNEKCLWQLRATRMKGRELFVVKRYDDVHTCSIEIVQGHHHQVKSWMIGECVKAKYLDPTNTSYRPRKIIRDMHDEFGVSFNFLRT